MNPDDIPTEITKLMWTAPFVSISPTEHINLTAPDTRAVLAHFWPAIEAHLREQIATEIEKSEFRRGVPAGSGHYVGGYIDGLNDAASLARTGPTT